MNNLWRDIKEFLHWRQERQRFKNAYAPLLSMELTTYNYADCLLHIAGRSVIPYEWHGELAAMLWARSCRGKVDINDALDRLEVALTGRVHTAENETRMQIVMGEYP